MARALLESLERRFAAEGHEAFYSSSQENEPEPQSWHRHMGFVQCGVVAGLNGGNIGEIFFRKVFTSTVNEKSDVEETIRLLELRLLDPEVRSSAEEMSWLLTDDFLEIGASGRLFDKLQIIASLRAEEPRQLSVEDFKVRLLAPEVALATYQLRSRILATKRRRLSLRSSLWVHVGDRWLLRFHQGTRKNASK